MSESFGSKAVCASSSIYREAAHPATSLHYTLAFADPIGRRTILWFMCAVPFSFSLPHLFLSFLDYRPYTYTYIRSSYNIGTNRSMIQHERSRRRQPLASVVALAIHYPVYVSILNTFFLFY